jgi:exodeoxyribonuclease VII small subunit
MKNMTYETAMAELKKLSDELESGELTLDESLEVYTKAVELIKICNKKLQDTQKQMTILIENFEGEMKEVPFNEEDYRG